MANFPLDSKFEELREIIDSLIPVVIKLKEGVSKAGDAAKDFAKIKPSGSAPQGGGSTSAANRTAAATERNTQLAEAREAERISRQFVENFGRLRESARTIGTLSKKFGFKNLAKDADLFADRLEFAEKTLQGLVSSAKLLGAGFVPAVVAVVTAGGALLAFQKLLQNTLGITATLSETVQLFGLGLERGFRKAQEAYLKLQYAITGNDNALIVGLQQAQDAIDTIDRDVSALIAKIESRPVEESEGFIADAVKNLGVFADEGFKTFNKFLGFFQQTTTGAKELSQVLEKRVPTALESFKAEIVNLGDATQGLYDFMLQGIQQVSATIASTLLSAFLDPQADIREAFASLFRSLAQQLLQLIIQTLIVRAISGVGGFNQGGEVPQALARGGRVRPGGRASIAHAMASGFAAGGMPFGRPSWIPASDTVPAWLTPGEYVQPVPSVAEYGADFMEGLRQRRFPSLLLRAAAGLGSGRRHAATMGSGAFALGGGVSGSTPALGPSGPSIAVMVPDEQTAHRLFAQAPGAFLEAARQNRSQLRAILGR